MFPLPVDRTTYSDQFKLKPKQVDAYWDRNKRMIAYSIDSVSYLHLTLDDTIALRNKLSAAILSAKYHTHVIKRKPKSKDPCALGFE